MEIKCNMNVSDHPGVSNPEAIPRTFRWILTNEEHPQIHWWMKSLKTDYINKNINIEIFDDAKGNVFNWIQSLVDQEVGARNLILKHLDKTGNIITIINFNGLKLKEHTSMYDYKISDILTHKILISYNQISRKIILGQE